MCNEDENIKIAIICGYDMLRRGLINLVRAVGYCIQSEYATGKEFILNLDDNDLPSLIFIDIDKYEKDAYETITYLKANHPSISILVLTIEVNKKILHAIKGSGANGFVLKSINPKDLESAIRCVRKKGVYFREAAIDVYNTAAFRKSIGRE